MKNKIFTQLICCLTLMVLGCSNENFESPRLTQGDLKTANSQANVVGAKQITGVGFFDESDACESSNQGAYFALNMTGDLEGCLYVFVDDYECSPSGTYREIGRELFVGTYNGESGTFWTNYRFEAKYEGCSEEGFFLGAEIFGRCQHPIIDGSGDGVFEGVTGRLNFYDDIETGSYPYKGHLMF
jgi:hypothetical protein